MELSAMAGTNILVRQKDLIAGSGISITPDTTSGNVTIAATNTAIDESRLLPTGGQGGNLLEYQEGVDRGNNVDTKLLLQPATSDGLIVDQAAGNAAPVDITNSGNVAIEANALVFSGENSLLIPANALGMTLGGDNEFTIDIEFQLDSVKSDYATLYGMDGSPSSGRGALYFTSSGAATFTDSLGPNTTGWTLGTKHRITIERWNDNGTWKTSVYRNGSFLASSTSGINMLNNYVFPIGSNNEGTGRNFVGKIWAFRISNKAEHRGISFAPRELPFLPPAGQPVWAEGIDRSRLLPDNPTNGDMAVYRKVPEDAAPQNLTSAASDSNWEVTWSGAYSGRVGWQAFDSDQLTTWCTYSAAVGDWLCWEYKGADGKVLLRRYSIANGQRDYNTIPMFGARFSTKFKVDGVEETIVFTYSDQFELLGDAPTAKSLWLGSKTTSTAPMHFAWLWDSTNKRWILRIAHEGDSTDITSVSGDSAEPSLFPWEYKAYEFSNWSPGVVTGYMISGFEWQGSRIVVNGIAQYSSNGGHDVNGSYVSLHADPENYAYDSTNKNWCWFNKFGCRFGRWNGSTGWALNSRDATFFSVSATNSSKLPWKDEDFSSDSSYNYGPSNFLVNGRAQDNPTGFTSAVDVIKCDADLKGRYVLVGYRTITADGGFEELVYRKADNGCKLVWDGSKWTLYGPDLTDWYVTSNSDQLHYPQDQSLTWEVGVAGEGSAANLPLIVAVPGEAKLPKANKTVLNVAGAGIAEADGTYNPVDGVDAFGSSMVWLKSGGAYKIWCNAISGAVANWLIGEANSITGKYILLDPPGADGTISGPYNEDGSSKTWQTAVGSTDPAPAVTAVIAKDTITLSGASPDAINGTYELVDDSAEGDERIWTNGTYFVARGTSYTVWMVRNVTGRPSNPGSGGVYFYGSDTSKANPYNDDGTSYSWYAMNGSGTLQITK